MWGTENSVTLVPLSGSLQEDGGQNHRCMIAQRGTLDQGNESCFISHSGDNEYSGATLGRHHLTKEGGAARRTSETKSRVSKSSAFLGGRDAKELENFL